MPQTHEAIAHAKAAEVPIVVALNKIDLPNVDLRQHQQDLRRALAAGPRPRGVGRRHAGRQDLGDDRPGDPRAARDARDRRRAAASSRPTPTGRRPAPAWRPRSPRAAACVATRAGPGRDPQGRRRDRLRRRLRPRPGPLRRQGPLDRRGRPVDARRGLRASTPSRPPARTSPSSTTSPAPARSPRPAAIRTRGVALGERQAVTLENLYSKMAEQKIKSLNLILKADVQGSLEALIKELEKLENDEVPIRVLLKGVGGITESDIVLADASQAIVIGFRVAPEDRADHAGRREEDRDPPLRHHLPGHRRDQEGRRGDARPRGQGGPPRPGRRPPGLQDLQGRGRRRLLRHPGDDRALGQGPPDPRGPRDLQGLDRGPQAVQGRRQGSPRRTSSAASRSRNFDDVKTDDVIEAYRIDVIRRTL